MKKTMLFTLGVVLLYGGVLFFGGEDLYALISEVSLFQVFFMTLLQALTLCLTTLIWYLLIREKTKKARFWDIFLISLSGAFVESITPSVKIGGETTKMYLLNKKTGLDYKNLTAITVVSKLYSLGPFCIIAFISTIVTVQYFNLPIYYYFTSFILIIFFAMFYIFFKFENIASSFFYTLECKFIRLDKKNNQMLKKLLGIILKTMDFIFKSSRASKTLARSTNKKLLLLLISVIVWILYPVKVFLVTQILGFSVGIGLVILGIYTAYLVSMIPLLPGGLATFEGTLMLVLSIGGLTAQEGFSIALMTRAFTFWIPLFFSSIVFLRMVLPLKRERIV